MIHDDYEFLRRRLRERSGLVLSADKQYLVESRLLPVVRRSGLGSLGELVAALRTAPEGALATAVVEAMTTNESFFFRDKTPFEHFRQTIMPALTAARRASRSIRIWCAAASTGQEPYSLAMCLKEMGRDIAGWHIEIIATDLSGEVLEKARAGLYTQFEVQRGLPIQLLIKYFAQTGELWQIAPDIRSMVKYRQLNLLHDFSQLGPFDVIFCRNVLIYFDQDTKTECAQPDGVAHRRRRLSGSRCGRNRGRTDRPLQNGPRQTRSLHAEPDAVRRADPGQERSASGCDRRRPLIRRSSQ